jgi:sigma-B regulation protein RsbU (phosphoserine phosphatase)
MIRTGGDAARRRPVERRRLKDPSMRLLLLRDPVARRPQLEAGFAARGHSILAFDDPRAALDAFHSESPEIVVVDLSRDAGRGAAFCRSLRGLDAGAWAVVVAITASDRPEAVEEAVAAGADDCLSCEDSASVAAIRIAIAERRFEDKQSRRAILGRLQRAESRLQEILETAPDAIIGCGTDGAISMMNEQALRMTGYERSELMGRPIELLVPAALRVAHVDYRNRFFAHPGTRPMGVARNLKLARKDGVDIDVDICLGYQVDGDRLLAVAAVRDITERRRMEEELRLAKQETERAYERIRREIDAAARVQRALLPTSLPQADRVRFAYRYQPCATLGGDALNVFWLDAKSIGLYLLDVSGHGVAASLLSVALARVLSTSFAASTAPTATETAAPPAAPAEVARRLNRWLLSQPTSEQYFTMIFAVVDAKSLLMRYVSAGHPPMLLARADGGVEWLSSTGIPVGLDEDAEFEEGVLQLTPGDRLLLYSDGVTEAPNGLGEMFGAERLRSAMTASAGASLEPMLVSLDDEVQTWCGGAPVDDVSLLALEILSSPTPSPPRARACLRLPMQ